MKIACIGNMNNNFFALTRFLRDKGYEADLLLMGEDEHFLPKADTFTEDYKTYTRQLNWIKNGFFCEQNEEIKKDIQQYDFIIGCNYVPFFLNNINRQLDLFVPYGSDLYEVPFYNIEKKYLKLLKKLDDIFKNSFFNKYFISKLLIKLRLNRFNQEFLNYCLAYGQRKGIEDSKNIFLFGANSDFESILLKLRIKGAIHKVPILAVYTPLYNKVKLSNYFVNSHHYKDFKKIRDEHDIIIFHHARHAWKNPPNIWTNKRNDILLNGFANFIKSNPKIKSCLITFEYGPEVTESKLLIKELCIENNVIWFPKMERKEIFIGITMADIGAVEFGMSWITGGVLFEFLSMGVPVMQFRNDKEHLNTLSELYPIIKSNNADEITESLKSYSENPEMYRKIGEQGRLWFEKYLIDNALNEYIKLINASIKLKSQ